MVKFRQYIIVIIILYAVLNLVGLIPFGVFYENDSFLNNYFAFFMGLAGLALPLTFSQGSDVVVESKYKKIYIHDKGTIFAYFKFFLFLSFASIAGINIMAGGIVIFKNADRFTNSAILTYISELSIGVILLFYAANRIYNLGKTRMINIYTAVYLFALLTLGYRTPVIVLVGALAIINSITNRSTILNKKVIIGTIIGVIIMSMIEQFRIGQDYDLSQFYKDVNFNFINDHAYLLPLVPAISLFRYDQTVVSTIIHKIGLNYMYGGLAVSNFLTVLPGEQLGSRNIIGNIVGARNIPGKNEAWSITPTLQGALYVDGGYIFIFIGFFAAAFILYRLFTSINKNYAPANIAAVSYIFVNILKSLHSGYIDVDFFIVLIIIYIINHLIIKRIALI